MASTNLGKVGIQPRGDWDASASYPKLSMVSYSGGSYLARHDVPAGTPLTNTAYWMPISDTRETFLEALEQHPEWVTTVEDGSITTEKLSPSVSQQISGSAAAVQTLNSRVNGLQGTADQHGTDISVLDSRMAVIEAGTTPEGSEITTGRVGWDGTTYETIGDAIREQVRPVSAKTENLWTAGRTISPKDDDVPGYQRIYITLPAGTYTFIATVDSEFESVPNVSVYANGSIRLKLLHMVNHERTAVTFTVSQEFNYIAIMSAGDRETSTGIESTYSDIMLVSGTRTDTTYIPPVTADDEVSRIAISGLTSDVEDLTGRVEDLEEEIGSIAESIPEKLGAAVLEDAEILRISDGQLRRMQLTGSTPFHRYIVVDDEIIEQDNGEFGTDYIECPPYIAFSFHNTTERVMVYFYTKDDSGNYTPRWDVINFTTSSGAIKNYLSFTNTYNRVTPVPVGTYVRFCVAVGSPEIYGWSGLHFGPEQAGTHYTPKPDTAALTELNFGTQQTGLTIPGNAKLLLTKNWSLYRLYGLPNSGGGKVLIPLYGRELPYTQCTELPDGYWMFRATLRYVGETPSDLEGHIVGNANKYVLGTDFNEVASALYPVTTAVKSIGAADKVLKTAKAICDMTWVNLVEKETAGATSQTVPVGYTLNGVPYSSKWTTVHMPGWHITKHTMLNAANDPQSKFYAETDRSSPGKSYGYGLVCSAFVTLASGFPYPITTDGFLKDPQIRHCISNQPVLGAIAYNGSGHCLIPESISSSPYARMYSIYECTTPVTLRRTFFDFFDGGEPKTRHWSYMEPYRYMCYRDSVVDIPYDVTSEVTLTNGSARPYFGDRCVCTSITGVKIDIADNSATKLFVQRCTYSAGTKRFTPTGDPISIDIGDETQIDVPTTSLTTGFYGFYTDADDVMEYIEYREVSAVHYSDGEGDAFTPPTADFWYLLWWSNVSVSGDCEIIPKLYENSSVSYADYRAVYKPNYGDGYAFFKGTLGAYVVPLICDNPQ